MAALWGPKCVTKNYASLLPFLRFRFHGTLEIKYYQNKRISAVSHIHKLHSYNTLSKTSFIFAQLSTVPLSC